MIKCTYSNNLTLSIGATVLFEIVADTPPIKKSWAN